MKPEGTVLLVGGSPNRAMAKLGELCDTYGNIKITELVNLLIKPRPSWAVVVKEYCRNKRGNMVSEVYHKSFTGNVYELEYWMMENHFEVVGLDGPYYPQEVVREAI